LPQVLLHTPLPKWPKVDDCPLSEDEHRAQCEVHKVCYFCLHLTHNLCTHILVGLCCWVSLAKCLVVNMFTLTQFFCLCAALCSTGSHTTGTKTRRDAHLAERITRLCHQAYHCQPAAHLAHHQPPDPPLQWADLSQRIQVR
jgi:hypothetical protein